MNILPIKGMQDLVTMGDLIAQSTMFGTGVNPAQGFVIASHCHQTGMSLLEFIETYNMIKGRPSMKADAMLARMVKLGGSYKIIARDGDRAAIEATYADVTRLFEFTWAEAQGQPYVSDKQGNLRSTWATPRGRMQMLWARVISDAVRAICPLANNGSYTPEESETFDDHAQPVQAAQHVAHVEQAVPVVQPDPQPVAEEDRENPFLGEGETAPTPAEINYAVCPVGAEQWMGMPWVDFDLPNLQAALATETGANPGLLPGHYDAIRQAIAQKPQQ